MSAEKKCIRKKVEPQLTEKWLCNSKGEQVESQVGG